MNTNVDLKTLCHVSTQKGSNSYVGCGVMVSPLRMLTAFHVVQGKSEVKVTGENGRITYMKSKADGGRHIIDKSLDLAVIELQAPITEDYALTNFRGLSHVYRTASMSSATKGWLGTMFDGKAREYEVGSNTLMQTMEGFSSKFVSFDATVRAVPGYSGSPVFAEDGVTVISVVSRASLGTQDMEEHLYETIGAGMQKRISFQGPSPDYFSDFMRKVDKLTGFAGVMPRVS